MYLLEPVFNILESVKGDQNRLLFSILLTFPIGFLNNFLHGKTLRCLYGLIFGILIQFYMYQLAGINVFVGATVTLLIIKIFPRSKIGWIVTIYAFSHLSAAHIYRMIYDYAGWSMDVSTILMMVVCKFAGFAFCYSDGERIESLPPRAVKNAIKEFSILDYYSYIYFYPTCIMGPFFEFSEYMDYLNEENEYKNIPKTGAFFSGISKLVTSFIFAGIYLFFKPYISVDYFMEDHQNKFLPNSIIFCGFYFQKYRYIIAFLFTDSICAVSGLAYRKQLDPKTNTTIEDFDRVRSINIKVTETSTSLSNFFRNWNISVHHWLKKYVYFRIYKEDGNNNDKRTILRAKIITFMISGFWHGFYPSYYIVFSHFSMDLVKEENLEYIKKNISKSKLLNLLIDILSSFIFLFGQCYLWGVQDSLHVSNTLRFMASIYFIPTILLISSVILSGRIIKYHKAQLKKKELIKQK